MAAKQLGEMSGAALDGTVVLPGHRPAQADFHGIVTLVKHFPYQPQGGKGSGQQRQAVEEQRVASAHMYRQYRCPGGAGQTDKAALPGTVADTGGTEARDFTRGKDDQCSLRLQVFPQAPQLPARRAALQIVDRQQHRAQGLDGGEQVVGNHLDIGAHAAHQL